MARSTAPHDFRKCPHTGRWQRREHGSRTWKHLMVRDVAVPAVRHPGGRSNAEVPHVEYVKEWTWV